MHHRLLRSAIALAAVLVTYSAYALLAVPLIEPPARKAPHVEVPEEQRAIARAGNARYQQLFSRIFPADHWAHQDPKVLESDQVMLLIQDYRTLRGGRMELVPCVMLFLPEEDNPEAGVVLLDAPQGAVLQFEEGFNLGQARVGKLLHGTLLGEITVYSEMQHPGPEDDLKIVTRDLQLSPTRIWTEAPVSFRLGNNTGQGTHMEIRLLPSDDSGNMTGINVGGLQSFHLARDVQVHLEMQQKGLLPGKQAHDEPADEKPQPPVEITCRGAFHFDLVRYVATFEDQVDVHRLNPSGPSDQMNCELLSIYFQPKPDEGEPQSDESAPADQAEILSKLQPTVIEARGDPVVVRSPSTFAQARCRRLEYNLITRKITLEDEDRVMLEQGPNKIEAPMVHYQPGVAPGDLGTLGAKGPGWLQAASDKDPDQLFKLHWQQDLQLRPHQGVQVVSIVGRPRIEAVGMGAMTADEMHLWLREPPTQPQPAQPPPTGSSPTTRVEPDRLLARGNVEIESPELTGETERLEVWFRHVAGPPVHPTHSAGAAASQGAHAPQHAPGPVPFPRAAQQAAPPKSRYAIEGDLVRMQVLMRDRKADLSDVTVDGSVVFREMTTAQPHEKPLVIRGNRLQLSGAEDQLAHVVVNGQPAHIEARGMTMQGAAIELDQESNRLWINGTGSMSMPMQRDLQGQPLASAQTFSVTWQGQMQFDGRTARFERQVVGLGPAQRLQTELLEAELKDPVRFAAGSNYQNRAQPAIHEVRAARGVSLENRTIEQEKQVSIDRMQLTSLRINQTTGEIAGEGPGWLTSVRIGGSSPLELGGAPQARPPTPRSSSELDYLRVDFSRGLEGNINRRQVSFVGNVRSVYGPVPHWDQVVNADDPLGLGEQGMLLDCERLMITEMRPPLRQQGHLELEALGNTLIEGRSFTARAHRLSYTQAKDLLVLEGSGHSDAQLWRQTQIGSPASRAAARKILFWRASQRVEVDDARYLDLSQVGGSQPNLPLKRD